jgi:microcystin-dependent protein
MEGTIAEIRCFAGNFAPKNWAFCNAQTIAIQQNTALFSLLGTTFGGNGTTTFQLPDLQGRVPVGTGNGAGLTPMVLGQKGGTESNIMLQTQMPQHTHIATFTPTGGGGGGGSVTANLNVVNAPGTLATGGGNLLAGSHGLGSSTGIFAAAGTATVAMAAGSITVTGGGGGITGGTVTNAISGGSQPFPVMQPYLGMNYIICMYGIFPSRN